MWADPLTMENLGPVKDETASDAAIARHDGYRHEGLGFFVLELAADTRVVGFCGLKRGDPNTPIAGEIEAGWVIARDFWRRGYALEAMIATLDWAWMRFDPPRIVAIASERNAASQQLMIRLGMTRLAEGNFIHPLFSSDDPLRHTVTYSINRPEPVA